MSKILDTLTFVFTIFMMLFTGVGTFAFLNVITRPEMITVAVELPQRIGVVTLWDPIDNEIGLGDPPDWYHDYEIEQTYDARNNIFNNSQQYSVEDHVCMAKNIYFEARNESLKGKIAVALVTLQRVEDSRYPNTVCGVVYDSRQFSWYWDGLSDRPRNQNAFEEVALIASAMLHTDTAIYDFTYGATHYHADYVDPYWKNYMVYTTKVDTHVFYYEPRKIDITVMTKL